MRKSYYRFLLAAGVIASGAGMLHALDPEPMSGPTTAVESGAITLREPKNPFDKSSIEVVTLGKQLEFECQFYIDDFFDKSIIWAGASVRNPTERTMYFHYNVAFFDDKNQLIGCTSQDSYGGVEPQQTTHLGSCLIPLDRRDLERVTRYQVRVYESSREIGAAPVTESAGEAGMLSDEK